MLNNCNIWFLTGKMRLAFSMAVLSIYTVMITPLYAGKQLKHVATIYGNEISKPFNQPCGLFYDEAAQKIYIADTMNNRLVSFDSAYKYLSEFSAKGKLETPTSLVRDNRGRLIITESRKNKVTIIDVKKKTVLSLDFSQVPPKDPVIPGNLTIDKNNNLYVVDRANKRILVFNNQDKYQKEITAGKEPAGFNDVKVDENGNIYTLDTVNGRVYIFNRNGEFLTKFGKRGEGEANFDFPVSLAVDRRGLIYVVDRHKNMVLIFNKKGDFQKKSFQLGWNEGKIYYPEFIFIDKSQRIFIVDRDNNRINIYKR